ncbi:MAG: hypothetical protein EA377_02825 [Phycisphaerales bacterium]|nr:MAG: hypothetical protein EA377_02825 [Phycisphaerales bacterium]
MHPYVPRPDSDAANEEDVLCENCGYNLRGLAPGRACPECGRGGGSKKKNKRRSLIDPFLHGDDSHRSRFRTGLFIIAVVFLALAPTRLIAFGGSVLTGDPAWSIGYRGLVLLAAVAWVAAVWKVTPPDLDTLLPKWRRIRQTARLLAWAWLPGAVILLINSYGVTEEVLLLAGSACRLIGGIGVLVVGVWLYRLAEDAELEKEHHRINLAVWVLPLPTLLLAVVSGPMAWFAVIPLTLVYIVWVWGMLLYAVAAFGMGQHVRWAMRYSLEQMEREERIKARKKKLEEEAAGRVRETRSGEGDIPLT